MSNEKVKALLHKLREELNSTDIDDETRMMVERLDDEVNGELDDNEDAAISDAVMKRARKLETRFAVEHPLAEKFIREIVEMLARMGV